jgi:hypothetical protein
MHTIPEEVVKIKHSKCFTREKSWGKMYNINSTVQHRR